MVKYKEVLEEVAKKEMFSAIFWIIVFFIIIGSIWAMNYFYFKKIKKKYPKKYNSEKQVKVRRQCVWGSIALSTICLGLGALLYFIAANTVSDINKDIAENSYITYTGGYYISGHSYYTKYTLYDGWLSVDFDNNDYAYIYIDGFFERISTEEGSFEGKVVYGKNSLIVVDVEK